MSQEEQASKMEIMMIIVGSIAVISLGVIIGCQVLNIAININILYVIIGIGSGTAGTILIVLKWSDYKRKTEKLR